MPPPVSLNSEMNIYELRPIVGAPFTLYDARHLSFWNIELAPCALVFHHHERPADAALMPIYFIADTRTPLALAAIIAAYLIRKIMRHDHG